MQVYKGLNLDLAPLNLYSIKLTTKPLYIFLFFSVGSGKIWEDFF